MPAAAAEVLHRLTAAGVRLELADGAILAGPRTALTDETRALIRANKPALVAHLADTAPAWRYLITLPTGERFSSSFTPPATLAEVRAWYPGAAVEVEPDAPSASAAILEPADWHGYTLADLETAAGEDWPEFRDRPAALVALATLLRTEAHRHRGEVPPHYTHVSECANCGPVLLWPGAPTHLTACPWCLTRAKGAPIPRPPEQDCAPEPGPLQAPRPPEPIPRPAVAMVTCCTCTHWRRDMVGDGGGLGRCLVSAPASLTQGSLWPRGEIQCKRWEAIQ